VYPPGARRRVGPPPRVARLRTDIAGSIDVPATLFALAQLPATAPGGRDLGTTITGTAFGMRRTFMPGQQELRLDGREHPVDFDLF